jgi:hypothetical protein
MSDLLQLFDEQVAAFLADNPDLAGLARSTGAYPATKPTTIVAKPLRIDIPFREWPIQGGNNERTNPTA